VHTSAHRRLLGPRIVCIRLQTAPPCGEDARRLFKVLVRGGQDTHLHLSSHRPVTRGAVRSARRRAARLRASAGVSSSQAWPHRGIDSSGVGKGEGNARSLGTGIQAPGCVSGGLMAHEPHIYSLRTHNNCASPPSSTKRESTSHPTHWMQRDTSECHPSQNRESRSTHPSFSKEARPLSSPVATRRGTLS
jgi:hypothetical protein